MIPVRAIAAFLLVLALALPGTVLADSAGDQQYQDPLGNSPSKSKTHTTPSKTTTPTQTQTPSSTTTTPSTQTQSSTSTTTTTTSSSASSSGSDKQLPRTGLDVRVLGGIGVAMIGLGVLLRRRLTENGD